MEISAIEERGGAQHLNVKDSIRSLPIAEEARNVGEPIERDIAVQGDEAYEDEAFPATPESIDGSKGGAPVPACDCGVRAKLKTTMKEGRNQGRNFWVCHSRECNFFRWADTFPTSERARRLKWRRFSAPMYAISPSNEKRSAMDAHQGALGDCWLLSALSVIAESEHLLQLVCGHAETAKSLHEQRGAFVARLFKDGRWHGVPVDCYLPCDDGGKPAFARPGGNKQLWAPLIEKAFAKLHGSYAATVAGEVSEALLAFTGCPCETVQLQGAGADREAAWTRLIELVGGGFPVGCAAVKGGEGLVGSHAYSILDAREVEARPGKQRKVEECLVANGSSTPEGECQKLRMVKVRNPWGKKEWEGRFRSRGEEWTSKLQRQLGRTRKDDGSFWMEFNDFASRFFLFQAALSRPSWHACSVSAYHLRPIRVTFAEEPIHSEQKVVEVVVMALRPSKRGRGSLNFWLPDLSIAVFRTSDTCSTAVPIGVALSPSELSASVSVRIDLSSTSALTIVPLSFCKEVSGSHIRVLCPRRFHVTPLARSVSLNLPLPLALCRSPFLLQEGIGSLRTVRAYARPREHTALCLLKCPAYYLIIAANASPEPFSLLLAAVGQRIRIQVPKGVSSGVTISDHSQRVLMLAPAQSLADHKLEVAYAREDFPLLQVPCEASEEQGRWHGPNEHMDQPVFAEARLDAVGESLVYECALSDVQPSGSFEPIEGGPLILAL